MERPDEPTWQPLSALGLIGNLIDAQVEDGRRQHQTLSQARPYLLDDATVERLLRTYSETETDLWLYDTQLDRWAHQAQTIDQRREVARLRVQMICLRDVVGQILAVGARLKTQTIETLLAKSDLDVAVEHLLGGEATGR